MPGSRRHDLPSSPASSAGRSDAASCAGHPRLRRTGPQPLPEHERQSLRPHRRPARDYCEDGAALRRRAQAESPTPTDALDPLSSLAKGCADAAAWIVGKLSDAVKETANVDFTNAAFLRQYAVVFAASTVLTLVLWLLAVAKRAVRGVPLTTAISEAIGFLWLTVLASAFTPLILYTVVSATDGVTEVIATSTGGQTDAFFGGFSEALKKGDDIGGGPIMLIVVALVSILAAGVLWLELVIRAALLYVGALLGTVVYAGPRRQEHVGPRPPLGRDHDRGHPRQTGHHDRAGPGGRTVRRRRARLLLRRRLRPRHHPARDLRLRDDLPLRARLR